jgi:hypothetical protein
MRLLVLPRNVRFVVREDGAGDEGARAVDDEGGVAGEGEGGGADEESGRVADDEGPRPRAENAVRATQPGFCAFAAQNPAPAVRARDSSVASAASDA